MKLNFLKRRNEKSGLNKKKGVLYILTNVHLLRTTFVSQSMLFHIFANSLFHLTLVQKQQKMGEKGEKT